MTGRAQHKSGFITDPAGLYTYSLSFDLSGMVPGTAKISGLLAADNTPLIIFNGIDVGFSHPTQYFSLEPFVIDSCFLPGINTLEFIVSNNPAIGFNPTELLISDIEGSANPVPIRGAVWLLGTSLICFIGLRRNFKQS